MTQTISIIPVAKPRMVKSDKWKQRPVVMKYWAFKDELRLKFKGKLSDQFKVTFTIPMPKSWSKKKKKEMVLSPHQSRPDLDNFVKALNDCLAKEDSHIHTIHARKIWGYDGEIYYEEL